jgi:ElaB/YqjD/DUF883 family membrane-anchored ribosome-binding protein
VCRGFTGKKREEYTMQSEPLLSEAASNGHPAGSTPAQNAAAEALESDLAPRLKDLIADMGELIKSAGSLTVEELGRAKAKLRARIAAARVVLEDISARARDSARAADRYVRERPWQAVGISAGVGLLIGLLAGRRGR